MSPTVPVTPVSPVQAAVADYLAAVGHDLAGLPEGERQDILEEVAEHLADVAAELGPEADARALETRLGPASTYAAELRAAAGYDAPPRAPRGRRLAEGVQGFAASARASVEGQKGGPETLAFLRSLRPAWWVLRAWVLAEWLAWVCPTVPPASSRTSTATASSGLSSSCCSRSGPFAWAFAPSGSATQLRGSARSGQPTSSRSSSPFPSSPRCTLTSSTDPSPTRRIRAPTAGLSVVDGNGNVSVATNLFAFGPDGQPIDHVRLYDQDGHPVVLPEVDNGDCWAGTTTASPVPTASPSNVFPLPQLTPQLDADGNPTGTCVVSSGAPGFVVPPLAGYTPTPTPSPSASVSASPTPSASHASPSHASPSREAPPSTDPKRWRQGRARVWAE